MKVTINGQNFNTSDAVKSWTLEHDGAGLIVRGSLHLASDGTWYCDVPSQSYAAHWRVTTPLAVLEEYASYLTDKTKVEITDLAE